MSFTVLRVEVDQWEYEEIFLPVRGQSEEGVEADDVVEEEGNHDGCGQLGLRQNTMSPYITPRILNTECWWIVEFDRQLDIGEDICGRQENV